MNDLQRLAEFIKDIKFTMFSTVSEEGAIYARPMANLEIDANSFDGKLWFFTRKDSPKVYEIAHDQHVNLAYANPDKQQYASLAGRAYLSEDEAMMKKLWNPMFKAWFPEGLDDPQISLISVHVESAELWDSPNGKIVQLAGFLKAAVTGQPYDGSKDREHIEVRPTH